MQTQSSSSGQTGASFGKKQREEWMKKAIGGITMLIGLSMAALNAAPSLAQDKEIHRVVTTLDKSNKSDILFDSLVGTEKGPADFSWDADRSGARKSFAPSNGGTYLLIVDFLPVGPEVDKLDVNTMMNVVGLSASNEGGTCLRGSADSPQAAKRPDAQGPEAASRNREQLCMATELPDEFFGMLCFSEAVDIRRSSPDSFLD
jgi:hypothetical protein